MIVKSDVCLIINIQIFIFVVFGMNQLIKIDVNQYQNQTMISDYIMKNINIHFQNKTALTARPQQNTRDRTKRTVTPTLTKQLIKQSLPGLIRRNNEPLIVINQTKRKSPSPISKSRLKMVLQSSKQENLRSIVKKSPARIGTLTAKTSVSDLMDCKSSHCKSTICELEQHKENNILDAYRQKRKAEIERQKQERSVRKVYGKHGQSYR